MFKILPLLLLLNSCNCGGQEELVRVDGQPCVEMWDGEVKVFTKIDYDFERFNKGECQTGTYKITKDGDICVGTILPTTEKCNNLDDDCDGIVDENENGLTSTDYALLIDFSGSMDGERLEAVREAICYSPENLLFANNRYAIVGISISYSNDPEYYLDLVVDFTDLGTACAILESYNYNSGIDENQIDATQRQPGESLGGAKRTAVLPVFAHKVIHRLWMRGRCQ